MLKLFIDFDNTVTIGDVGDAFFRRFAGAPCDDCDSEYRAGRISAKECLRRKCALCGPVDRNELDEFIDTRQIDPSLPDLVAFANRHGIGCTIVSEGFDYTVRRILQRFNLGSLPVRANGLSFMKTGGSSKEHLVPFFPSDDEECTWCACCRRNVMLADWGDDDILVFIGDGYSGRCPARYADIIFARAGLQTSCQHENISYFEFRTFNDVQRRLGEILRTKRVRRRRAAESLRQALLMAG